MTREDLRYLVRTWKHRAETQGKADGSATLMCATDLQRLLERTATTEPGEPPAESDAEPFPFPLPDMKHPRPLPKIEEP